MVVSCEESSLRSLFHRSRANERIPMTSSTRRTLVAAAYLFTIGSASLGAQATPLASWNDGPAKRAIMSFVRATTDRSSPQYTAPDDRIATFDNDGTLWVEHPFYTEGVFSFD